MSLQDWLHLKIVQAQVTHTNTGGNVIIKNPLKDVNSIPQFINKLLEVVIQVGLPLLVLAFVYVGFLFVTARGNDSKLKEAKMALLTAVIGAAVILGAGVISTIIQGTINSLG